MVNIGLKTNRKYQRAGRKRRRRGNENVEGLKKYQDTKPDPMIPDLFLCCVEQSS